jgi:thioredoxin-like negative regulator of GroEL
LFLSRAVYAFFEALFKEGRHEVAQELLSQSPANVQNHADVGEIFYKMKLELAAAALADG